MRTSLCRAEDTLSDLLALLDHVPDTLLVLNHPRWDVARVGAAQHASSLRSFLARHRPWIHALEINGLRSWSENREVLRMGEEYDLPVVAGGDRHGCRPTTLLNLTQAATWADFVAEIRSVLPPDAGHAFELDSINHLHKWHRPCSSLASRRPISARFASSLQAIAFFLTRSR